MNVEIEYRVECDILTEAEVCKLIKHTLVAEGVPDNSEVSVSFVDAKEIQLLNAEFRNQDKATDVLSFPIDDPFDEEENDGVFDLMVGEIIVCPEFISSAAPRYKTTYADELRLLLVHSALHLLGYDHLEDEEAEIMEKREEELLTGWTDCAVPVVGPTTRHEDER